MKQIHIATLLLSVALLSLSQLEYHALSPLAHLPDPAMASPALPSHSVTLSAVGATTAARAPGALPLLPRTRLSPPQHDMSARGEGRADCHYAVQTICKGLGSRGWSH